MPAQTASSLPDGVVQSEATARALIDAVVSNELFAFRQGPLSPAELAAQTQQPVYRALRCIRKWEKIGVLRVHSEHKRAGRPIRRYALSAPSFFIPAHVLPLEDVAGIVSRPLEQQLHAHVAHALRDAVGLQGSEVFLEPRRYGAFLVSAPGQVWDGSGENLPVLANRWATLKLSYADACAMRDELDEVFARYADRAGPQTYWLHLRLVPETSKA